MHSKSTFVGDDVPYEVTIYLREAHRPPISRREGWFIGGLRFVKVLKEEGVRGRRGLLQESSFPPHRPFSNLSE